MTIVEQLKQEGIVRGQALSLLKQLKLKSGPVPSTVESDFLAASRARLDLYRRGRP